MASAGSAPSLPRSANPSPAVHLSLLSLGLAGGAFLLSAGAHAVLGSPLDSVEPSPTPSVVAKPSPEPSPSPSDTPEPPGPVTFTLLAGGDVMPHDFLMESVNRSGTPNWAALWSGLDPWISAADLAICQMEVPVAPPGVTPIGYPVFAAPPELVPALAAQGWDGCSTASNHSLDQRWDGILSTLGAFDAVGMGATGTARSAEEAASAQVYEVRQGERVITVAHIAYTWAPSSFPLPSDKQWSVNVYPEGAADVTGILAAAQAARDAGANVVVLSVHGGVEYRTAPSRAQRETATKVAESGLIDLYIGHHTHVPQPIELLSGGPYGEGMWVAFGLGNYISNQDNSTIGVPEAVNGLLLTSTITVDLEDKVTVGVEWTAVTVDRTGYHTLHVISEIPEGVGNLTAAEVAARYQNVLNAVGTAAPERTMPPEQLADEATYVPRIPSASTS